MAWQMWAVILAALFVLWLRELRLKHRLERDARARLDEDRQVAELDALYELDWEWPR